jgi:hypothetical protein
VACKNFSRDDPEVGVQCALQHRAEDRELAGWSEGTAYSANRGQPDYEWLLLGLSESSQKPGKLRSTKGN